MRIAPIRQVLPKLQGFEHKQITASLHLFIYGYQT